jgi:epoxide hydrolase 4
MRQLMTNTSAQTEFSWNPERASGITTRFVAANGQRLELAEAGDVASPKIAILLHGFPELNFSWRQQIPALVEKGWRVWAPNLRGYGASSKPEGIAAYRIYTVLQDVAALIDLAKAENPATEVMLIAHDWGAIIAWMFAIRQVRPLDRLVIMNVPHPKCAEREIRKWRQLRKSWYMFFFQIPWLPEKLLLARYARAVRHAFTGTAANKGNFSKAALEVYAAAAQRPGAMTAMLNYYRALLRFSDMRNVGDGMVHTDTLVIWGENDLALDIHLLDGIDQWVPRLTLRRLPGISHWVQQDAPDEVNALLTDWLGRK